MVIILSLNSSIMYGSFLEMYCSIEQKKDRTDTLAHLKELIYKINHPLFNGLVILAYEYKCTDVNITMCLHYLS